MGRALKRTGQIMGAGALVGLGYLGTTWARYGKPSRAGRKDPLLDRFMPEYEVREVHQARIPAPADVTFAVAKELDLQQSPLLRAIFAGRELFMHAKPTTREPQCFVAGVQAPASGS